jgi:hypothetical protein
MTRTLLAAIVLTGLSGAAWADCPPGMPNNVLSTGCPNWPKETTPHDLMIRDDPGSNAVTLGPITPPCCVTFSANGGAVTIDLDKGTVDLGGVKMDDAARAFWDAVRRVAGRPVTTQRTYTPDEIDQTWLIQMTCTAAPGASRACEQYPGKTLTFTSNADLHSESDCRTIATDMARKYHYMSGNDYAFRCIVSDYQPKELP